MECLYDIVAFDIDGTLCPSGRVLAAESLRLIDETHPDTFRKLDRNGFNFRPFTGVERALTQLQHITRLAIISNGPHFRQRNKLILLALEEFFGSVYISGELARISFGEDYTRETEQGIAKPNTLMFERINADTRTFASRSLYVGNRQMDYEAASKAGWDFIGVIDSNERYENDFFGSEPAPKKLVRQREFARILEYATR